MNKFFKITCFVFSLSPILTFAQVTTQQQYGRYTSSKVVVDEFIGSPYLYDDWRYGSIKLNDKEVDHAKVKYNILDDSFYIQNPDGNPVLFNQAFDEVILENRENSKTEIFKKIPIGKDEYGVFQVLFDEKIQLLKKAKSSFIEILEYNEVTPKKKIIKQSKYYAQFKGRQLTELKVSKKNILNLMADKAKEVDDYIKKYDIDLKSDADLAKVFKYYNSLLS